MKKALHLFSLTITSIILLLAVSPAYAVPGNLTFIGGTPQSLTVCQNSTLNPINSFLTTSDDQAGEALTWSVFLAPSHGTLAGFNATATSIVGNNTPSGLSYTPTAGYSGGDLIQIQVSNGINSAFTQINITVQTDPTPTFTTAPPANICTSTSVTYTTQSGGGLNTYSWTVPGVSGTDYSITSGGIGSANSTVTLTWISIGSKTVTVNYHNLSGCPGVAASNTTTVNARPTVTFTSAPGANLCAGTPFTYTTQAGQLAYTWVIPGTPGTDYTITGGSTATNTVTISWITAGSKTVTVNYNNAAGCNALVATSNTTNVHLQPVASFTVSPLANICAGSSATYTTQAGQSSYVWTVPGIGGGVDYTITSGGIGGTNSTVTLTWITAATRTVQVNYTDVNGCTSASNATNTTVVHARPVPSFTSSATALSCAGVNITYATQPGNSSYIWTVPGVSGTDYTITGGGTGGASSSVTLFWITAASSPGRTVTVNYTDVNGCTGVSAATNTTTVDAVNATFTTAPTANTCAGSSVTYTTQAGDHSYAWVVPGVSGTDYNISSGGTGAASNTVTLSWATPGNQTVTVNYQDANNCTAINPASNTTNVHARPIPSFTAGPGANTCAQNPVTYTTQAGESSYIWTVPGVSGTAYTIVSGGTTGTNNTVTLDWIATGSQTVTINYTDANGCTGVSAASNTTNVHALPTPTFTTAPAGSVCTGSSATYTTQSGGGISSYTWSVPGVAGVDYTITSGGITGTDNTVTLTWLTAGNKTVTVNYSDINGCTGLSPASNTLTVVSNSASFTVTPNPVCLGSSTTFNSGQPLSTYAWSFGDATTATGNPVNHTYASSGTFTATLTVTNALACVATATHVVTVNPSPAAISGLGTGNVCTGATLSLTDATGTGTWSSSTPALAAVGSSTGVVTGFSPGSPTIYYTIPNGCQASATITVNQTPTGISGTFSACTGGTQTLTNGYSGGVWSSSIGAVGTVGAASGIVTALSPGTTTITYTLTGNCTATVVFTDNVVPAALGGATSVCPGLTATVTDATPGGSWTSSATGVATIWSGSGLLTGVSAGTTNISYTMSTGCYATAPFTVNPLPAAITGTTSVCVGLTRTLSDATAGGTWTSSTGAASVVGGTVTGLSAGNPVISYTLPTTCYVTTPFTVNPLPAAIGGTTNVCVGLTTTLTDATGGGLWSSSTGAATVVGSTGVVTGSSPGTPTISYTLPTGCLITTPFTVNALPSAIGGTLSVCVAATTPLSDAGGGTWVSNNTAVATIGSSSGTASGVSSGTSTITYTLPTGCLTTSVLTVNPNPASITGSFTLCPGTTTTLADAAGGGNWISNLPGNASVGTSSGVVTGIVGGTTALITYFLPTGCATSQLVTVNAPPAGITFPGQGIISPVAGTTFGFSGNGGLATAAQLESPIAAAFDASGNIYVSTNSDNRVRKISPLGVITAFAGTGGGGFSGDAGQATAATFNGDVEGVAVDASGNVYIADAGNARVRKVNTSGIITTIAGGGGSLGDGGQATAAQLTDPNGLAFDGAGNLYIADGGGRIRRINTSGIISTFAGGGGSLGDGGQATAAQFSYPAGVAVDQGGNVYVADYSGQRIRKINTSGIISTIAGNGTDAVTGNGGQATAAEVAGPYGVAVDGAGNIYIAEYDGSRARVINSEGVINPLAGNGTDAVTGNGSPATAAETAGPTGFAIDATGNVYITEYDGSIVRTITETPTLCAGSTITLSDATGGGSWSSSNAAVATIGSGTGVATAVGAGTGNLTYTSLAGCTATIPFRVSSAPASVSGTNNVCVGATDALSDAIGGGLWSSSSVASGTVGSTTGAVTGVAAGTTNIIYNTGIVYTMTGGCTAIFPLTVNSTPAAITGSSTVCTGATNTITLSDVTGGGTWTSSNTALATVAAGVVTGVSSGALTITYTTSPGSCFAVKPMTVNPTPSANTGSANVCQGGVTTLANSTSGGSWSSLSPGNATVGPLTGVVSGVTGGTTAVIAYTMPTTCFANTTVTINNSPSAISGATSVCVGSSTPLSNLLGGGTWVSGNPSVATINSGTGSVTGVAAGTLTITYTVGTCSATYAFTVNPQPSAIVGNPQLCTGLSTTFSDGIGGGVWSSPGAPGTVTVGSSSGSVTGVALGSTTIVYTLPAGCSTNVPVTVNTQPAAIVGGSTVCTGLNTVLTDATAGGAWTSTTGSASVTGGTVTGVSAGTTTISYTGAGGCNSILPMTVNPSPAAITGTAVVCTSNTTTLSDVTFGGTWSAVGGAATVGGTTGIVSGVSLGLSTILYTLPAGCFSSVVVTVNQSPAAFTVNGGGAYCSGGAGSNIGLSGSAVSSVNYQLYRGTVAVGAPVPASGSPISFGSQTVAGTYTVVATNTISGCSTNMTGSVNVSINPLPNPYTVTGGGAYCSGGSGVHVGISGTDFSVISYQLINSIAGPVGSSVAGTGTLYDFGLQTNAGVYTILATNTATTCSATMTGSVTVTVNPLPVSTYSVTAPGGAAYCAGGTGVHIGLSNADLGIAYQLYNGGGMVGSPLPGAAAALDFGLQTLAGSYTIVGTNATTGCSALMTGSQTVTINPLPTVYGISAPAGAGYCTGGAGVDLQLSGSNSGISYQLKLAGASAGLPVAGTGVGSLDLGIQPTGGVYTATATNTVTGCSANMSSSVTVSVNPLPTAFNVTVTNGGVYCAGGLGQHIGLNGSQIGVSYQLSNSSGPVPGATISGTGGILDFGLMPVASTYSVTATNTTTSCASNMTGNPTISTTPLPTLYPMSASGGYCYGGTGVDVSLTGSDVGTSYQLYLGATPTLAPIVSAGVVDWGLQTVGGTYTVKATNPAGCSAYMTGNTVVSVNPLPASFTVSGGGNYCSGGTGVNVGLSGSALGVNYQLYVGGIAVVGGPTAGTGFAFNFGLQTTAGSYTVIASSTPAGCNSTMSGSVMVNINPLPAAYNVTGGGSYCIGGTGSHVGLSGSDIGISYQLWNAGIPVGTGVAGTGAALDFGALTTTTTYTVTATNTATTCANNMTGSATITTVPLPTVYNVSTSTGSPTGSYCAGGVGVQVVISGSDGTATYQLFRGSTPVGIVVSGTGLPGNLPLGTETVAGTYTVVAYGPGGCSQNMSGSATISINPLPAAYTVTGGGGYCSGGSGVVVGLGSSTAGVSYQLVRGGATSVGAPVIGSGTAINFPAQTIAGTYTVVGSSLTCSVNMLSSAVININLPPSASPISIGGSYCSGGAGVDITLGGSAIGVNYQLKNGVTPVGSPVTGTGGALDFHNQTAAGLYTIVATNASTGCTATMTGSATININPLPSPMPLTGGGSYCLNGSGDSIGLLNSATGILYYLYFDGAATALPPLAGTTGSAVNFGAQIDTGTYTVYGYNIATTCSAFMPGSVSVHYYNQPVIYPVAGGGNYCSGGVGIPVSLTGSELGTTYKLYNDDTVIGALIHGTGSAINFGNQTAGGSYMVVATNTTTTCSDTMFGSPSIVINNLPATQILSGAGSYCPGGTGIMLNLSGSESGVNYQVYNGTSPVGSPVPGTTLPINIGPYTTPGIYTVVATNISTFCTSTMNGNDTIAIYPVPTAYTVTGGGNYCAGGAGVTIGLSNSQSGISYRLWLAGTAVGVPVVGTGSAITFGSTFTGAGTYTAVATNLSKGCTNNMGGTVSVNINSLPFAYNMTGGGGFCTGGTGVHIGLTGSSIGVNYQLYLSGAPTGSAINGTGSALDFGVHTAVGTYTVIAKNISTTCTNMMLDSVMVNINPLPTAYTVSAGASGYCVGGTGVVIYISGTDLGVNYELYRGTTPIGVSIAGTGTTGLDFGPQTIPGSYTVIATNTSTGCVRTMTGAASFAINPLPAPYAVTGGGNYCAGTTGVHVGLAGSSAGVNYQLSNGTGAVGAPVAGTGSLLDFGIESTTGMYTVVATNTSTGCSSNMSGSATVGTNPLPVAYTVTGGGSYCSGGTGVHIGLSGSVVGTNYRLYEGSGPVSGVIAGTGLALDFGPRTTAGGYTVMATDATTSCANTMTGGVTVGVNPLPATFTVTGGGNFCPDGTGVHVGLYGSVTGVNYQLYRGTTAIGASMPGTGFPVDYGLETVSGTYTVVATDTPAGCMSTMSGSATVGNYPLPAVYNVIGGGSYCAGGAGVNVGLDGSNAGITYQLYVAGATTGIPASGTGAMVSFGMQTTAGTYTVVATNAVTTCVSNMVGSAAVTVNPIDTPSVTINTNYGGSNACASTLVTLSAMPVNGGVSPAYQWTLNGRTVGADSTYSYIPSDGDVLSVMLTSSYACAIPDTASNMITLTVLPQETPSIAIDAVPGNVVCRGSSVEFTATETNGGAGPLYTWKKNGIQIPGATTVTYSYIPTNTDVVSCELTSNYQCRLADNVLSNAIVMEVDTPIVPQTVISATPGNYIQKDQTVTFTATVTNAVKSPTYQWFLNGRFVPDAVSSTYTDNGFQNLQVVTCVVTSGGGCGGLMDTSNAITMHVNTTGVQQVASTGGDIQLVPNPNKGIFTLKGNLGTTVDEEVSVEITNMLGQVIYNSKVMAHNGQIDEKVTMSNTPANGMYLLNVRSTTGNRVFHMVIEQ